MGNTGQPAPSAAPKRQRSATWLGIVLIPVFTTLALLGVWELLARTNLVIPSQVPPFTEVMSWLFQHALDERYVQAIKETIWHWFAGLALGAGIGAVLGVALGSIPLLQRLLTVPLEFLRPIPAVVYLPLLILLMGARSQTVIVLAALGAFWPMLFQTIYGVHAIDPQSMETGKVFGLNRRQQLWNIMLPSVLPYMATGLRIASSLALVIAISVELVGGVPGLGAELGASGRNALFSAIYGLLIISGFLGLLLNGVIEHVEKRLLRWHVSHRSVNA